MIYDIFSLYFIVTQCSNIPKIVWRRRILNDAGGNHDGFTHANFISFDVGYANKKTCEDL